MVGQGLSFYFSETSAPEAIGAWLEKINCQGKAKVIIEVRSDRKPRIPQFKPIKEEMWRV
jgi:hypothetical protein